MERRRMSWISFWRIRLLGSSDVEGLDGDELWENAVLNQTVKSVLGWREKIDMHHLTCRGKVELDGLFKCVKHFIVKRRKGKLSALCEAMELRNYSPFDIKSLIPTGPRRRKWEKL
ncbi:hypothetical protein CPC08DRAFT_715281 [Agrocybe pediades]|nr:hypothetical protein CPC08DRAFT_715281 [Agrocybe pediades]